MYLAAVIEWFSRYVIAWRLSNTLEGSFCLELLDEALSLGRPEVFNTDQGVQFTQEAFTSRLLSAGVAVSMDGKGRCLDNVFVERLWRSVKYEEIYLRWHETVHSLQSEGKLPGDFAVPCQIVTEQHALEMSLAEAVILPGHQPLPAHSSALSRMKRDGCCVLPPFWSTPAAVGLTWAMTSPSGGCGPPEARGSTSGFPSAFVSLRRRILAVTGSSADARRVPVRCGAASMVFAAFSALICPASSATLGPGSAPSSGALPERPALSWSRRAVRPDR